MNPTRIHEQLVFLNAAVDVQNERLRTQTAILRQIEDIGEHLLQELRDLAQRLEGERK